ncbi:hypothetical protein Pan14r_00830 [Crateriforma conspicua]|uniref:Autotransporter-associated beta strand repeat protein n=2 Tax=Crateriforma conspicua TaxID=2527996 RepID=A0A5C5Y0Q9_9PLAN|nr:hypothetical protein Pan14r_00830 [Crateriforma conspicua]
MRRDLSGERFHRTPRRLVMGVSAGSTILCFATTFRSACFNNWFMMLIDRSKQRNSRRRPLALEKLDARRVLAAFLWSSDVDGAWSDAGNWQVTEGTSVTGVPGSGDTVIIDRPGADPVITIDSVTTVDEIVTAETLAVTDKLTVNRTLDVAGTLRWSNGDLFTNGLSIDAEGRFEITGTPGSLSSSIRNEGTVDQSVSFAPTARSIVIENAASGTWTTTNSLASDAGFAMTFNNRGVFQKTGDANAIFPNTNSKFTHFEGSQIVVTGGTLSLPTSGTGSEPSTGSTFNVAAGATLDLLEGIGHYTGTYTGVGDGRVEIASGASFQAGFSPTVLDFPEDMLHWTGGLVQASNGTIENQGFMHWSGDDGSRSLRGRMFVNTETIVHEGSSESLLDAGGQGTLMTNASGAVIQLRDTGSLVGGKLVNEGVVESNGESTELDSKLFAELGSRVEVTSGTLNLTGGGSFASTELVVANAAELVFNASAFNDPVILRDGAVISGSGDGKIEFRKGRFDSTSNNAAIDFQPGLFQWSGGEFVRNIRNLGEVTVVATDSPDAGPLAVVTSSLNN